MVDQIAGEPPTAVHPVAWFGSVMQRVERVTYRDHRAAGVVHLAVGVSVAAATGIALERLVGRTTATAIAASVAIAGRMLTSEAAAVIDAVERDDLLAARARVTALVGRDTTGLPASELVRATIESVAENTVDAVTAPIFWAAVAGPTGVLVHRAVNTLDAMVGHRNARYERFGWASARLDDVLNWIPARLGALTVIALRPRRCKEIRRAVRRGRTRSPVAQRRCHRGRVRRRPRRAPRRDQHVRRAQRRPRHARPRTARPPPPTPGGR